MNSLLEGVENDPYYLDKLTGGQTKFPELPSDLKNTIIFSRGTAMGGQVGEFLASRILTFPMGQDSKTARAVFVGADSSGNFLNAGPM